MTTLAYRTCTAATPCAAAPKATAAAAARQLRCCAPGPRCRRVGSYCTSVGHALLRRRSAQSTRPGGNGSWLDEGVLQPDGSAFYRAEHSDSVFHCLKAQQYIRSRRGGRWALHLSLWRPHPPWVNPAPYHAMYPADDSAPSCRPPSPLLLCWQRGLARWHAARRLLLHHSTRIAVHRWHSAGAAAQLC